MKKRIIISCCVILILIAVPTLLVFKSGLGGSVKLEPLGSGSDIIIGGDDTSVPEETSPDTDNEDTDGEDTDNEDTDADGEDTDGEDTDGSADDFVSGVYGLEGIDTDSCTYLRSIPVTYEDLTEHHLVQFAAFSDGITNSRLVCIKVNPDYVSEFISYAGDEFIYYSDVEQGVYILFAHSIDDLPDVTLHFYEIDEDTASSIDYIADVYLFDPVIYGEYGLELCPNPFTYFGERDVHYWVVSGDLFDIGYNEFYSIDISSSGDYYFGDVKVGSGGTFIDSYVLDFGDDPQPCDIYFYIWLLINADKY